MREFLKQHLTEKQISYLQSGRLLEVSLTRSGRYIYTRELTVLDFRSIMCQPLEVVLFKLID